MPNDEQPSYTAVRKMRGMKVGGKTQDEPKPFISNMPKDQPVSVDIEDRRKENEKYFPSHKAF